MNYFFNAHKISDLLMHFEHLMRPRLLNFLRMARRWKREQPRSMKSTKFTLDGDTFETHLSKRKWKHHQFSIKWID